MNIIEIKYWKKVLNDSAPWKTSPNHNYKDVSIIRWIEARYP